MTSPTPASGVGEAALDAPSAAFRLLETAELQGGWEPNASGSASAGGNPGRQLKEHKTRTPPEERVEGQQAEAHNGDTEVGEGAPMEDDPELVADADPVDDPGDLVAFVRRVTRESNLKIDRIKAEHDNKLEAVSRRIQSQLKKQEEHITQLTAKVDQGQAHTERVRQQVIQEGHKNDGRYAERNKNMEEMMELVRAGRDDTQEPPKASSSSATRRTTSPRRGGGDPCVLRTNTHSAAERG